ncbi:hypothetical protein GCM10010873_32390 [Cypionkella aquatica]|uniref:Uncharacterized protein n=1 Tax=Cypionkella aquatica TaxID=1756042 RepID=A0AA37X3G4_9RHOB|nr:hypothetical protein [Cypionkella aquatica]GLS88265.1 hypothetical protein GCM10010873_32390 [Cypionkella aquatica]
MTYQVLTHRHFASISAAQLPVDDSLPRLTRHAAAALAGLALITLQSQYDMAAFRLRGLLQQMDKQVTPDLPLPADDTATLLWRLQVFDAHCDTHFLTGLRKLQAWIGRLRAHDLLPSVSASAAVARFLEQQRSLGGLLTNPQRNQAWDPVRKGTLSTTPNP